MGHLLQFKLPRAQVESAFSALRGANGDDLRRELASLLCPFLDNENVCEIACCTALKIGQYPFPKMKDINSYSSSILNLERNCAIDMFVSSKRKFN